MTSFAPPWRLLDTGSAPGDWNMAADEAVLEAVRLGHAMPTLRFYRWERPTLSLGYAQRLAPERHGFDPTPARAAGVPVVRRPSGGRAVLHAGDFTYSLVTPSPAASVRASYAQLAEGLAWALERLGVAGVAMGDVDGTARSAACFASTTRADLRVAAGKLLGSAQVRRAGGLLQHGTLYLRYPAELAARVFPGEPGEVADLASVLGREPGWDELKEAFMLGLQRALVVPGWEPGELSAWELERIEARKQDFRIEEASLS